MKIFDKVSGSSLPRATAAEIICGDCAGDELMPLRTKLTTTGACAVCGGRSFVMAAPLAQALARHITNNRKDEEIWKTEILHEKY